MAKFAYDQLVTTTYHTGDDVFRVKGINENIFPAEYWLEGEDGGRETFPENAVRAYVKPFNPQAGEYYTSTGGNKATVLAHAWASDGTRYVMYEFPSVVCEDDIGVAYCNLAYFKSAFPNLTDKVQ